MQSLELRSAGRDIYEGYPSWMAIAINSLKQTKELATFSYKKH